MCVNAFRACKIPGKIVGATWATGRVLHTGIVERRAFRDVLDYGGALANLDPAFLSNVDKAIQNAHELAGEVVVKLTQGRRSH